MLSLAVEEVHGHSRDNNRIIIRMALALCGVAVPVVAFNVFASLQQSDAIGYWSLALTVMFSVFALWFIFGATMSLAQRSERPLHA